MSEEKDPDFEKIFSEIVSSEDLKNIQEDYEANMKFGIKELVLVQQSLSDAVSHVGEILLQAIDGENIFSDNSLHHNLLSSLYKIAEDFNESMIEYYLGLDEGDEDIDDSCGE